MAEREIFDCHHAEVSRQLATLWKLPDLLAQAIAYHHDPAVCEDPLRLVDVLHAGDALTYRAMSAHGTAVAAPEHDPGVFDRTGPCMEAIGEYLTEVQSEAARVRAFLQIARRLP